MSNYAWVCFPCQGATRRPALAKNVRCAACGQACVCLGAKIAVPPKSKPKLWESLRQRFYLARNQRFLTMEKRRVRRIHELEQAVARQKALPENPGRTRAAAALQRKLEKERE